MKPRIAVVVCLVAALISPVYASRPQAFHNAVKYRDAGVKPATGRSGSAAIEVRALRGRSETSIEVTTGHFDPAAAPAGKLDKVQVKLFASGQFTLYVPMLGTVAVGQTFSVVAGCLKRLSEDCATKFANVLNFQGEPHRPTVDELTESPSPSV